MNRGLLNQIAETKKFVQSGSLEELRSEESLGRFGFKKVKKAALVKMAAKIQTYVDLSLELRKEHPGFGGLPPTQLAEEQKGRFVAQEETAAIDQQRQLYAAARSALIDPTCADRIMDDLID